MKGPFGSIGLTLLAAYLAFVGAPPAPDLTTSRPSPSPPRP
jgi:hypothetical protein